jgi:hypothetical protein
MLKSKRTVQCTVQECSRSPTGVLVELYAWYCTIQVTVYLYNIVPVVGEVDATNVSPGYLYIS